MSSTLDWVEEKVLDEAEEEEEEEERGGALDGSSGSLSDRETGRATDRVRLIMGQTVLVECG